MPQYCLRLSLLIIAAIELSGCTGAAPASFANETIAGLSLFDRIPATEYYPLKKGNSWTYSGLAANALTGGGILEKRVTLAMRVVDVVQRESVTLFVMEGHPSDADWALEEEDRPKTVVEIKPSRYGYLLISNKLFRIAEDTLPGVTAALRSNGFFDLDVASEASLEMEMPLFKGLKFGESGQLGRPDLSCFWYVSNVNTLRRAGKSADAPVYTVVQRTGPDGIQYGFKPGLGITFYRYAHHGTKADVNLVLSASSVH